jgi:hypothetical protein
MLNITNSVQYLALTASSVALSLGIVGASEAIAQDDVFWDVEFFNESGVVVGSGIFSYDITTTRFINTEPSFFPEPSGFEVQTSLKNASFNLFGRGVFPAAETWWFDGDPGPAQQFISRFGEPSINFHSWDFVNDERRFATDILRMNNFELISEILGVGNWSFGGFDLI